MRIVLSLLFALPLLSSAQKNASVSFEKWISLKSVSAPVIAPDGKTVVWTQNSTDWTANAYDAELWMLRDGGEPVQLTRTTKGGSRTARFSPDSRWISFIADRGDKAQLYIISVHGGEALQVTRETDGIDNYAWSPDGRRIALLKTEAESGRDKARKDRYGAFEVVNEDYQNVHLWILPFHYDSVVLAGQLPCYGKKDSSAAATDCVKLPEAKKLTSGAFTVTDFDWSPDGKTIALTRQPDGRFLSFMNAEVALVDVDSKEVRTGVNTPTPDAFGRWSPDGRSLVYVTQGNDSTSTFFRNNQLFIYSLDSKTSREVAGNIDELKSVVGWTDRGLFVRALDKTRSRIYRVDPSNGTVLPVSLPFDLVGAVSFSKSGAVALTGARHQELTEVYKGDLGGTVAPLTAMNAQIRGWNTPVNEVISWKSRDGATIEGVLLKPRNFDPKRKYPLLLVIHGGPTATDFPDPVPTYVYPVMQWVEKGALVLRVNYRGSGGYGEKFRSLNVGNLGVGDMWDVMSGVDHLARQGFIDTDRMGCMGWSQGGYISAFLTTNTNRFKAISVGAGISNWTTYYVSTDITPFTRQYLKSTPWSDPKIYARTSPMTNINAASTPTLIQHGEFDKRVPTQNAYELYRGLQDRGIPSKLIIYKGFGHGINKPKERLAATWHNWLWFNRYVFGDTGEELPVE